MATISKNILANYFGALVLALSALICTPVYVKYMGMESYGLLGFFWTFLIWFSLLDFGFTPLITRKVAISRDINQSLEEVRLMMYGAEKIFLSFGATVFLITVIFSHRLSDFFFLSESISRETISDSLVWMVGVATLKLICNLYRACYQGFESQVQLNLINTFFLIIRVLGSVLVLVNLSVQIDIFFLFQFLVGVFEVVVFRILVFKKIRWIRKPHGFNSLKLIFLENFKNSSQVAFPALIWVFMTQLDKLILSKTLILTSYSLYMFMIVLSGAILQVATPIYQAVQPKIAYLIHQSRELDALNVYRVATQLVAILGVAIALMINVNYVEVVKLFGQNSISYVSQDLKKILVFFCWGNVFLAVTGVAYYLQLAHGRMRAHLIGSIIAGVVQIPIIIFLSWNSEIYWLSLMWLIFRATGFFVWLKIIHDTFYPGFHLNWLLKDILPIFIIELIFSFAFIFFKNYCAPSLGDMYILCIFLVGSIIFGAAYLLIDIKRRSFLKSLYFA